LSASVARDLQGLGLRDRSRGDREDRGEHDKSEVPNETAHRMSGIVAASVAMSKARVRSTLKGLLFSSERKI
jgi:hypothetical protein